MNCNLTNEERAKSKLRCRSYDCEPCREFYQNFSYYSDTLQEKINFLEKENDNLKDQIISLQNGLGYLKLKHKDVLEEVLNSKINEELKKENETLKKKVGMCITFLEKLENYIEIFLKEFGEV